jgi:hypothetical protein
MMRWQRSHRRGTRQPLIMSTGSGFWPAQAWLTQNYWPYVDACNAIGTEPLECEVFYRGTVRKGHFCRPPDVYALMTSKGTLK